MKWNTRQLHQPPLRFTPYAWAKLIFLRDAGDTEVGGFGITSKEDPLLVSDIAMVPQKCTSTTIKFDDDGLSNHIEEMYDQGVEPEQCMRIWIHTHPGDSPTPSTTDEDTFIRVFGKCNWAVMFILAKGGDTYARSSFSAGAGGEFEIDTLIEWDCEFDAADHESWSVEYLENVTIERFHHQPKNKQKKAGGLNQLVPTTSYREQSRKEDEEDEAGGWTTGTQWTAYQQQLEDERQAWEEYLEQLDEEEEDQVAKFYTAHEQDFYGQFNGAY